jgi:hypothetical protein
MYDCIIVFNYEWNVSANKRNDKKNKKSINLTNFFYIGIYLYKVNGKS